MEGAIALFDSAIKLGLGDIAEIYVCRGEALAALGRWDEALKSINAALEIEPYLAAAYLERGNIRGQRREYDAAINDYTMAIHIEPEFEEAYFSRALAYEERKRYADAEADLTRTLDLNPSCWRLMKRAVGRGPAQFKFDRRSRFERLSQRRGKLRQPQRDQATSYPARQRLHLALIPRFGGGTRKQENCKNVPRRYVAYVKAQATVNTRF